MLWKATLIGMYNYGQSIHDNLFDNVSIPDKIDRELLINQILIDDGEFPVTYVNYEFLKNQINLWFRRKRPIYDHMVELYHLKWDPIYNYDRYEELTDNEITNGEMSNSSKGSTGSGSTATTKATSYDSEAFQDTEQTKTDTNSENSVTSSGNSKNDRNFTHKAHLYGNIGVTTSVDMLNQDIEWFRTDIIRIIAEDFKLDFCIGIY